MRVLIYSPGQDTGGQGARMKELLTRHVPGIEVRSAIVKETYLNYPTDIVVVNSNQTRKLFDWAEVLHLRHSLIPLRQFGGRKPRPTILHHHGRRFIADHRRIFRGADRLGVRQFVSGLEMQEMEPGCEWLPQPHDIEALAAIRHQVWRRHKTLRIVQCPTRPSKGQALVQAAITNLSSRHDIEFDLVENVSWEECLLRKARADIFIDQIGPLAYGYGNNSVEAWAMDMPVISEAPGEGVGKRMVAAWGELPFMDAGWGLEAQLEALIVSQELRAEYAARGLAHAQRYHDYPAVAERLMGIYAAQPAVRAA